MCIGGGNTDVLESEVTTAIFIIASLFQNEEEEKMEGRVTVTENVKMLNIIQWQEEKTDCSPCSGASESQPLCAK